MSFWRRLGLPSFVVLTLPEMDIQSVVATVTAAESLTETLGIARGLGNL